MDISYFSNLTSKEIKMPWYKIWKNAGPGHQSYTETYDLCKDSEDAKECAITWADKTTSADYVVLWKKIRKPPKDWVEKRIKLLKDRIKLTKESLKILEKVYSKKRGKK